MEAQDYVLALKSMGMTQNEIAAACGITQPTVSKIERGDIADVRSTSYRALEALYAAKKNPTPATEKAGA